MCTLLGVMNILTNALIKKIRVYEKQNYLSQR